MGTTTLGPHETYRNPSPENHLETKIRINKVIKYQPVKNMTQALQMLTKEMCLETPIKKTVTS